MPATRPRHRRWTALGPVVLVVLAACTSAPRGGDAAATSAPPGGGAAGVGASPTPTPPPEGIARVQGCEPNSLLPADIDTPCGEQVADGLFSQLVEIDTDDTTPQWGAVTDHAVAASVTSDDARTWTIELEDGWVFHDGTAVTSSSFVDAWNAAAYGPNARANAFLFEPIAGFGAMNCPDPDCEPDADELAGLEVVDETTFTVTLAAPDRLFPRRLAHVAFSPLPPPALEDPSGWVEAPVGNGPLRMEGAWQHDELIALRAFEDYAGPAPAAAGVDLRLYQDAAAAWTDARRERLDVVTTIPGDPPEVPDGEPLEVVARAGDQVEFLVAPAYVEGLPDPRLVGALSRAIDRRAIIDGHLDGRAEPATGAVPAALSGTADQCGASCRFAPAEARGLLSRVGLPEGGIELWYDRDAEHASWVRAIAAQWRQHLGVDEGQVRLRSLPHTSWVAHLQDRRMGGLHPLGWSLDVASPGEYLRELHGPGGLFNFDGHGGPQVGDRLRAATTAPTDADARDVLLELERDVLADLHHVPLWTRTHQVAHGDRVTDVQLDVGGRVHLDRLDVVDG